jgi:hypothetical protein
MLKDKKYKNELELTAAQLKAAAKKPMQQTKLKLRKGFHAAPISYKVLMNRQLTDADQKIVNKVLVQCTSPEKCKEVMAKEPNWTYREISFVQAHPCGLFLYKGLSVILFYHRQVSIVEPMPKDPVPSGVLESEEDIWARLDLFSLSPRERLEALREKDLIIISRDQEIVALKSLLRTVQTAKVRAVFQRLVEVQKALVLAHKKKVWKDVENVAEQLSESINDSGFVFVSGVEEKAIKKVTAELEAVNVGNNKIRKALAATWLRKVEAINADNEELRVEVAKLKKKLALTKK